MDDRMLAVVAMVWMAAFGAGCGPARVDAGDSGGSTSDGSTSADSSTSADNDETSSDTGPADTSSSESSSETTGTTSGAPMILLLAADGPEITENGDLVFTAQVTDPDGLDDLVGGLLKTADGLGVYGPFAQISEGTFQIYVTWDAIHGVQPIEFTEATPRTFLAEFLDADSLTATSTVDVVLTCGDDGACDGVCTPLDDDEDNCGSCDFACEGVAACVDGRCVDECGNGTIQPGEQCDGANLQGFDCESLGLSGGVLGCDPFTCTFDTSGCAG
jgi:hypothetical protein